MKKYIISCVMILVSTSSIQALYNEPVVTRENRSFTIKMANTRGTGYEWSVENADTIKNYIILQSKTFESDTDTVVMGASGKDIFTFKALVPGRITLKFAKKRPWEKQLTAVATKNIQVIIKRGR